MKVHCGRVSQSQTNPDYILIMKPQKPKKDNSTVALHVNLAVTMHNLLSSGQRVWPLAFSSGDPGFKTRSDHTLNLFLLVPGSTYQLHL